MEGKGFNMQNLKLSKEQSNTIKGIAVLMLLVHHYSGLEFALDALSICKSLGPIICSSFFFVSGYGLAVNRHSFQTRYWTKRFLSVLIPFWLSNTIYIGYELFMGNISVNATRLITDFLGITLINGHCWFLQVLLLLYFSIAFLSARQILNNDTATSCTCTPFFGGGKILVYCMITGLLYTIITQKVYSLSWVAFPIGFYIANHPVNVSKKLISVGILLLGGSFAYYYIGHNLINTPVRLLNFVCLSVTAIPFIYLISFLRIPVKAIGQQSMNYYMMHGLCLRILTQMDFEHKYVYVLLYIVMVVIVANIFGRITKHLVMTICQHLNV